MAPPLLALSRAALNSPPCELPERAFFEYNFVNDRAFLDRRRPGRHQGDCMDLNYTGEDLAFRDSVRGFLDQNLPADLQHKMRNHLRLAKDDYVRWHRILARQGWVAPGWPVESGGPGWNPVQRHIWEEECARAGTPPILPFGVNMVAPVIMAFGSQAQKEHFLPRILSCEDWWCWAIEPAAGSDLASLRPLRCARAITTSSTAKT
jgi:alkylation response protein AidB-like acyl-CoA dehydrogenase